jgi:hypothetical protein
MTWISPPPASRSDSTSGEDLSQLGYIIDWATADVVLESCDGVPFPMSRHALVQASPFFEGMFNLPQAAQEDSQRSEFTHHNLPVVPMTERSDVLGAVLRCCYSREDTNVETAAMLLSMIEVADKYDMLSTVLDWIVRSSNGGSLEHLVDREPVTIYTLADQHQLASLARIAMRSLLRCNIDAIDVQIDSPVIEGYLTADAKQRLKQYHKRCQHAASHVLRFPTWAPLLREPIDKRWWFKSPGNYIWFSCDQCPATSDGSWERLRGFAPRAWFTTYISAMYRTLQERPLDIGHNAAIQEAEREAENCSVCAPHAHAHLMEFSDLLRKRVEKALPEINTFDHS